MLTGARFRAHRIAVAAVTVLVLCIAGAFVAALLTSRVSISVDGIGIDPAEYDFISQAVQRDVQNAGGSKVDLRDATIAALRRDQALITLARDEGVADFESVGDVLDALEATNAQRSRAVSNGDVLYGPIEYTAEQFYGKALADLRQTTVQRMLARSSPELAVSDAEVAARLDADPSAWSAGVAMYRLTRVHLPGVLQDPDTVRARLAAMSVPDLAAMPGAMTTSTDFSPRSAEASSWNPRTLDELAVAQPGSMIGPVPEHGGWTVIRVDSIEVDRTSALAEYGSRIRTVLVDEAFDRLLDARIAAQHVVTP